MLAEKLSRESSFFLFSFIIYYHSLNEFPRRPSGKKSLNGVEKYIVLGEMWRKCSSYNNFLRDKVILREALLLNIIQKFKKAVYIIGAV